jgi:hexosaminidase
MDSTGVVKVCVIRNGLPEKDIYSLALVKHKGIGKTINYKNQYSDKYTGGGNNGLLDGLRGSTDYHDGLWQGYHKADLDAVIDLGEITKISKVTVGFLQAVPSWIFFPENAELSVSDDGKKFKSVAMVTNKDLPKDNTTRIQDFVLTSFNSVETRFIRIKAKNVEYCPEWHDAAGSEAWLFVDEIIIE